MTRPCFEIALLEQDLKPALPWLGVRRLPFRHTYLRVTIVVGSAAHVVYIDGAPRSGFLAIRLGASPYYSFGGERELWTSGLSHENAPAALRLLGLATTFPARRYRYLLAANNSNSAVLSLLRRSGLRLPRRKRFQLAWDPRYPGWSTVPPVLV
jgi:hypothetical protein